MTRLFTFWLARGFLLLVLLTCAQHSFARTICWIESIAKEGFGVRIQLTSKRTVNLSDKNGLVRDVQKEVTQTGGFFANEGDSLHMWNSGHDTCTGKVRKEGDRIGIELQATFCMHLPRPQKAPPDWSPCQAVNKFEPAN